MSECLLDHMTTYAFNTYFALNLAITMKHFDETRNQCFGNTPKVREKYAHFKNWNYHMFKPIKMKDDNIFRNSPYSAFCPYNFQVISSMKTYRKKCKSWNIHIYPRSPFSKTNESYAHFPWNKNLNTLSLYHVLRNWIMW